MKRYSVLIMVLLLSMLVAACGNGGNDIREVTSIPDSEIENRATRTPPVVSRPTSVAGATTPTPAPLENNLNPGEARTIAQATDTAYEPTPRNEVVFEDSPVGLIFSEFYDGFNMRSGLILSDKLVSLDGQSIVMEGYVAPPLKPKLDFFVLTSIPMATCPFCSSAADWPDDIALVYLTEEEIVYTPYPVRVHGRLEVGTSVDAETGMVSLVRIYAEEVEILE